ncbi:hypothetical protein [Zooshikella ganghwensis]|nr:hypothetical protein [Zooshikella ganghwensis]
MKEDTIILSSSSAHSPTQDLALDLASLLRVATPFTLSVEHTKQWCESFN